MYFCAKVKGNLEIFPEKREKAATTDFYGGKFIRRLDFDDRQDNLKHIYVSG